MASLRRLQSGPSEELIRELINPTLHRDYALFFRPLMAINRAHVVMLVEQGILGSDDAVKIFDGLEQVDEELIENSIDAVASRDYILEALSACVGLTSTASRMSADLIAWSGWECRFVEVADGFATSSSIMPQKKNTMALDHIRAKMANMLGAYTAAATLTKGLAFTQMRETSSEIFHLTFDGFAEAGLVTRVLTAVLRTLFVDVERMAAPSDLGYTTATELADTLVKSCRFPLKTAHDVVATLVARSVRENLKSSDWGVDLVRDVAYGLGADVNSLTAEELCASLDPRGNVAVRNVTGGPAPGKVSRLLEVRRKGLVKSQATLDGFRGQLQEASQVLSNKVAAIHGGGVGGSATGEKPPTHS